MQITLIPSASFGLSVVVVVVVASIVGASSQVGLAGPQLPFLQLLSIDATATYPGEQVNFNMVPVTAWEQLA